MKYAVERIHKQRQVFLEVVALLDHLFRHFDMLGHVAKRVIPLFVTSDPSPSYIRFVVVPSGVEYDGKTYSGSYGDLGAMASPLHPKARSSDVDAKFSCTLREPMVKVIHSLSHMTNLSSSDNCRMSLTVPLHGSLGLQVKNRAFHWNM